MGWPGRAPALQDLGSCGGLRLDLDSRIYYLKAMPRPSRFSEAQILDATAAIVAADGPSAATIGAIGHMLKAPSGSIYHRFASRDVLLGRLWLDLGWIDPCGNLGASSDSSSGIRLADYSISSRMNSLVPTTAAPTRNGYVSVGAVYLSP